MALPRESRFVIAPQKHEAPDARTPGASSSTSRAPADGPAASGRRTRYFAFRPAAGAGAYPETRHCHASIVFSPS